MDKDKLFNRYSLFLILIGLAINIGLAQLVLRFEIPVFLDSIGTIVAAALGGYLPGITVGFLSNFINGMADPITLYYGIISIIIAVVAVQFSKRLVFRKIGSSLLAALAFALIGGGMGSALTWMLYGFNFGSGISAPFAIMLHESMAFSQFGAQLTADMTIDLLDKLLTVALALVILRFLPDAFLNRLFLGDIYKKKNNITAGPGKKRIYGTSLLSRSYRKYSLRNKVILLIVVTALILGALSITIGFTLYKNTMTDRYISINSGAVSLMMNALDADSINGYLEGGVETPEYKETERNLAAIRNSIVDIEYMYVYQIRPDGCHVVFDIDTPELPGEELGTVVPHEEAFGIYYEDLLEGKEIDPVVSTGIYGWLLTVYKPVFDSSGQCVAYAAADISMDDIITDRYIFIIRMASLLFGVAILIVGFAVWFAERKLVLPINAMAAATSEFVDDSREQRLLNSDMIKKLNINTGDEVENLYEAISQMVADVTDYITDINEKARIINQMQSNIIITFATMVENRDANTGEHIKHTSAYVRVIADELKRSGMYSDILTDEYIDSIVRSSPLHDIGKIKISDIILNKPGKLTPEEFEEIKTHTTAGREILQGAVEHISDTEYISQATDMAAYHHEKWDGTGYPEGLKGEEIPLCARIMAVADVLDALLSKRSYKEAMSFQQAKEIILKESGSHFDPKVVEAFMRVCDRLEALKK